MKVHNLRHMKHSQAYDNGTRIRCLIDIMVYWDTNNKGMEECQLSFNSPYALMTNFLC